MPIETVTATWLGEQSFLLKDHRGFPILMAQPEGVLGADLLPLSLIGCAAWDVMSILRKQKQPVRRCEVQATSERDDDPPWRFRRIHVLYQIWGAGIDPRAVERAIRLTEEKYCSVFVTLSAAVELVSRYEIVSEESSANRAA
jgi:putative redox protein